MVSARLVIIVKVLLAGLPGDTVNGLSPPVTVINPKGAVTPRLTSPVNPLRLVTVTVPVSVEPAKLVMLEGTATIAKSRLDETWRVSVEYA
jgi:hypothetical protein